MMGLWLMACLLDSLESILTQATHISEMWQQRRSIPKIGLSQALETRT